VDWGETYLLPGASRDTQRVEQLQVIVPDHDCHVQSWNSVRPILKLLCPRMRFESGTCQIAREMHGRCTGNHESHIVEEGGEWAWRS